MAAVVGAGRFTYEVDKEWGRRAGGVEALGFVSGQACDSRDNVYVFQRSPVACVLVFDPAGRLRARWGEGRFGSPHGIWIGPRDEPYLTDTETHLVTRWTPDGTLLASWGTAGRVGAPGEPFNKPTDAYVAADGEMYVSDGYGQQRVHRFGADGRLKASWGTRGAGPGEFTLPHDVWVDERDRVLVTDRENHRVQHFDRAGRYVGAWEGITRPEGLFIRDGVVYVAGAGDEACIAERPPHVTLLTLDGEILARWGARGDGPTEFTHHPHGICADSRGCVYVSEVPTENKLQKYTPR